VLGVGTYCTTQVVLCIAVSIHENGITNLQKIAVSILENGITNLQNQKVQANLGANRLVFQ
jgi:hypothetical protein